MDCCRPRGAEPFTEKTARRDARRFRRRGLDGWARRLADSVDPAGASVLEVGGGIGALQLELLGRGATRTTNVELSPAYEEVAHELARERGVDDAIDRRVLDFARESRLVEPADVVVLHRVVCCTPDGPHVVRVAAEHARRSLAFSFPRDRWWLRVGAWAIDFVAARAGWEWRFYIHQPATLLAAAEGAGFSRTRDEHGLVWELAAFERS